MYKEYISYIFLTYLFLYSEYVCIYIYISSTYINTTLHLDKRQFKIFIEDIAYIYFYYIFRKHDIYIYFAYIYNNISHK